MIGLGNQDGRQIAGVNHLRQSIRDILTTPIGSRVMRRDYGSRLFDLIDRPYSPSVQLEIIAASIEAISTWEPRVEVESVTLQSFAPGHIVIDMTGTYLPDGRRVNLEGIEVT